MKRGVFIVLEGLDGCGKSTQAERLIARMTEAGHEVVHTREPGGTLVGERIRSVLLDRSLGEIDPRCEVFLYQAARAQIASEVIRPALAAGRSVVCERWHYATTAYQTVAHEGTDRGAPEAMVRETAAWATAGTEPERAILLELGPRERARRLGEDLDRIEARGDSYRERVGAVYRTIFESDAERFRIVSAEGDIDTVHARVWEAVRDLI